MSLFVVRHRHEPANCPAADPAAGIEFLNYLSGRNARGHGLEIRGEAVLRGEHALFMIVDASDEERLMEFMKPFAAAGEVEVLPASTCAGVVTRGGCSAPSLTINDAERTIDPEQACQDAIDAGLVVHGAHPLNARPRFRR